MSLRSSKPVSSTTRPHVRTTKPKTIHPSHGTNRDGEGKGFALTDGDADRDRVPLWRDLQRGGLGVVLRCCRRGRRRRGRRRRRRRRLGGKSGDGVCVAGERECRGDQELRGRGRAAAAATASLQPPPGRGRARGLGNAAQVQHEGAKAHGPVFLAGASAPSDAVPDKGRAENLDGERRLGRLDRREDAPPDGPRQRAVVAIPNGLLRVLEPSAPAAGLGRAGMEEGRGGRRQRESVNRCYQFPPSHLSRSDSLAQRDPRVHSCPASTSSATERNERSASNSPARLTLDWHCAPESLAVT